MKKIVLQIVLITISLLYLTSCKKEYICSCTWMETTRYSSPANGPGISITNGVYPDKKIFEKSENAANGCAELEVLIPTSTGYKIKMCAVKE